MLAAVLSTADLSLMQGAFIMGIDIPHRKVLPTMTGIGRSKFASVVYCWPLIQLFSVQSRAKGSVAQGQTMHCTPASRGVATCTGMCQELLSVFTPQPLW